MKEELDQQFREVTEKLNSFYEQVKDTYSKQLSDTSEEVERLREENASIEEKYNQAQAKVNKIEDQLQSTVEQLESLTKSKAKGIDAMQLLDIYLILMESVFESQAHTRLLLMLHGDKEKYTLDELTMATGISGIEVRQAIFDLRNSSVVEYNDETQVVKLIKRFM